jgi:tetratricopeptide (TPR) repeat protein
MTSTTKYPIGWVGSLQKVPLAEILRKIALEERSGDLQIIFGRAIKTVYFDKGFLVFSASNLKRDRLGEGMIERGRISRQEFALASMLMRNSRRKFGQALVQAGVMSEEELGRQVALQVNRIVLSLFKVVDGIYSFDERPSIIPVNLMVSLSIYRIVLDGIRRMTDDELIRSALPNMKTRLRISERPPFTMDFRRLKPIEQELLRATGKGASLGSIVRRLPNERPEVLKAAYALLMAGIIEQAESPTRPIKVQEETGAFVLSEIQQKFAQIRATNVRQEILMEFDRLDRTTESALLKVDREAETTEIEKAYAAQKKQWEEKKSLVQDERSMVAKVEEIKARLDLAYRQVMLDKQLAEQAPARPTSTPPKEKVLEPAVGVAPSEAPVTLPPLNEDLIEEVGIEGDTPAPAAEVSSPLDTQPAFVEAPPQMSPSVTQPDGTSAPGYSASQREARIHQLFRDVKLHFQVRDWEGAVSLLYELVHLAPDNASYHGMLGRAMARHPIMRKDAERHFIEALRLAPQSADLHFSLGLYYKSFGMKSRAEIEFRTVLRIFPNHEGARKHLYGDKHKKDPLREMFRKIFG